MPGNTEEMLLTWPARKLVTLLKAKEKESAALYQELCKINHLLCEAGVVVGAQDIFKLHAGVSHLVTRDKK